MGDKHFFQFPGAWWLMGPVLSTSILDYSTEEGKVRFKFDQLTYWSVMRGKKRREHDNFVYNSVTLLGVLIPVSALESKLHKLATLFCCWKEQCRNVPSKQCWLYERDDLQRPSLWTKCPRRIVFFRRMNQFWVQELRHETEGIGSKKVKMSCSAVLGGSGG